MYEPCPDCGTEYMRVRDKDPFSSHRKACGNRGVHQTARNLASMYRRYFFGNTTTLYTKHFKGGGCAIGGIPEAGSVKSRHRMTAREYRRLPGPQRSRAEEWRRLRVYLNL
jgi:hypothetical protein